MRNGTTSVHVAAEHTNFIKRFQTGDFSRETYGKFLCQLYYVYKALEEELEQHKENPSVALIYFPKELNRTKLLQEDLRFFLGTTWEKIAQETLENSKATQQYVSSIKRAGHLKPINLVAHTYTRYLGDLSGGQIIKRLVQKTLNLPEGQGTAFYEFFHVDNVANFKHVFRQGLNSVEVTRKEGEELVQEARDVFMLNIGLFEELEIIEKATKMRNKYSASTIVWFVVSLLLVVLSIMLLRN